MAEWLRRLPAKQLGVARASSNLAAVESAVGVVVTFQISILKPRFRLPDGASQLFLFIIYIMPKRRSRRSRRRRRRGGNGDAGGAADEFVFPSAPTHTPVFTGSPRVAVAALAAGAAHDRAHRLAGRNVDPYRRRDWLKGPRGFGRKKLAEHAARAGRRHQLGLRGALRSGAAGGTRRRRRTRRRRKRRRSRRKR